ncbi:MAG TPA: aldo/keto reductase, partial [Verrucomicrobiae bacterium]|nr:aldo/keto reductase [Verrucomicrobiae bacterium]
SLGCWTMGGLNWVDGQPNGWANVNEDEITAAIRRGVDAGVNHFDNADVYGNGRAERMLARVLKRLGLKSANLIIASKMGHFRGTAEHAYDPLHIRHQCEQSLKNLQRDYLDIYYLHHGDFGPNGEWLAGAAATLDALVKEGKVRLKGQSAYSDADFQRAVPVVKPHVLQSWANILRPNFIKPDSVVGKLLAEREMSFVAFSPLQQGILLDKFDPEKPPAFAEGDIRRTDKRFQSEFLRPLKPKLARMKQRFGSTTEILAAVAQRYVLNHPHVACTIPGFRNEAQVLCNLSAVNRSLGADDMAFIDETFGNIQPGQK